MLLSLIAMHVGGAHPVSFKHMISQHKILHATTFSLRGKNKKKNSFLN
jgi:hypothetical protein